MPLSDTEVQRYANAFRAISHRKGQAPESVLVRNGHMADLLEELLELRKRNKNQGTL